MIICKYSIVLSLFRSYQGTKDCLQQALCGQPVDDDFALVAATPLQAIDHSLARATKFVISDRLALRRQMNGALTGRSLAVHSWFPFRQGFKDSTTLSNRCAGSE